MQPCFRINGIFKIVYDLCEVKRLSILSIFLTNIALAQIPPGYYDNAQGLEELALRQALHNIIDDHNVLSYNSLWGHMDETDAQPDGDVWDIYSYDPDETPAYEYNFFSDQCGTYSGEGDCYNREHSFPKSWFGDTPPMNSDLFHIYPTDGYVNGQRSNLPYGEVETVVWESTLGAANGIGENFGYNGPVFEPPAEYKGDLARTYFYMLTRYYDVCSTWQTPMMSNGDFVQWSVNTLIDWHLSDPVSSKEINRNNAVYLKQNNRNPFIDNPEWAELIWIADPVASVDDEGLSLKLTQHGSRFSVSGIQGFADFEVYDLLGRTLVKESVFNQQVLDLSACTGHLIIVLRMDNDVLSQRIFLQP